MSNIDWYKKSYRRSLVDMHIEDWNPEFLSEFSPDDYYNNLLRGKIKSTMIFLQSHVGHCYWPTKTGHMHNALIGNEDIIKKLIDKSRSSGIDVVGYYSLIFNTYEEDRHPEWKIHNGSGKSKRENGDRYGLCCPNNEEYRKFVFEQIAEIAEYFTLDGMFYDMLVWPEVCRCDSCKHRFANEVGGEMPEEVNWNDENWLTFYDKRYEWMGEFAMAVTNQTKRLMPGLTVEHNCASCIAGEWRGASSELVNEACDYTGGDLYGDLYNHSLTCKYYMNITKNPPFEYMTCRCADNLGQHTVTKTKEALELEIMLTCAHHGATFIIDAIDPKGTLDSRVYDRIGKIFEKHKEYEPYFTGDHVADVGVYYSTTSRYNRDGGEFTNKTCAINTVKTMIENHIPVAVVSNGCPDKMKKYKFVFAPYLFNVNKEITDKFIEYVRNGGVLYFSGAGNKTLLKEFLGAEYTKGTTKENRTYISPCKEYETLFGEFNSNFPIPFECPLPIVTLPDNQSVAAYITLPYTVRGEQKYASIHSDPPGIHTNYPALVIRNYGKGSVIWSAAPIENDERLHYKNMIMNLLGLFVTRNDLTVSADTTKNVEIVSFKTKDGYIISAIDLKCTEELIPIRTFNMYVKTVNTVKSVVKLPKKTPVEFKQIDDMVTFETGDMTMFAMYQIKY